MSSTRGSKQTPCPWAGAGGGVLHEVGPGLAFVPADSQLSPHCPARCYLGCMYLALCGLLLSHTGHLFLPGPQ